MAVLTPLPFAEALRVADALGPALAIGSLQRVHPIAAGSVNSNFFLEGSLGRVFLRIYEEQETSGVAYEWALLDHLSADGLAVPAVLGDVAPGEVRVAGKPVAAFPVMAGRMSCQRAVTVARLEALGRFQARVHRLAFGWRREGRFRRSDLRRRLATIPREGDLAMVCAELDEALEVVDATWPRGLPRGVTHGDLFRDNVLWAGDELAAVIDWESAADDFLAYDLAVTMLAWCCGDTLDWGRARALVAAYNGVRPLSEEERAAFWTLALAATARFSITRITDFHLRDVAGAHVHKDYRRFLMRLRAVRGLGPEGLRTCLGL